MPRICPTCKNSNTYIINAYYQEAREEVCTNCNCSVELCICKPAEIKEQTINA